MMALFAPSTEMVDKVYNLAIELGATCEGPAGPRPDFDPNFYAGYFRDLDGNKMNVFNFKVPVLRYIQGRHKKTAPTEAPFFHF